MQMKWVWAMAAGAALCGLTSGCASLGPRELRAGQADYAQALGDAKKRQILAMMVGLRYADAPAFLNVTSIIASYSFAANGGPNASFVRAGNNAASVAGTISYGNNPTFTFAPITGEAYATSYIRPLSVSLILPLADGGIPIDLLLRITTQSIGGLQNGTALGGPGSDGSPGFFELLHVLRRLQLAGEFSVRYKETDKVGHVYFVMGASANTLERAPDDLAQARQLLALKARPEYEVVTGEGSGDGQIAIAVRSMLGILSALGAEIRVPAYAVANGSTKPTIGLVGGEERPTIVVHAGHAPADAYVAIGYGGETYWIDRSDFDSKYAFSVVQQVMALAEITDDTKGPLVTIPAG
jgi:hypothetical protein